MAELGLDMADLFDEAEGKISHRRSQSEATRLVDMAHEEGLELFHDHQRRAFARVPVAGHWEVLPLTPEASGEQAEVVKEIFHLSVDKGWACKRIADHLNRPGGPPSPSHVDTKRNVRRDWAKSTIRAMLKNPTYTVRGGAGALHDPPAWAARPPARRLSVHRDGQVLLGPRSTQHVRQGAQGPPLLLLRLRAQLRRAGGRADRRARQVDLPARGPAPAARREVLRERIFGPMRVEKLERQLRASGRRTKRKSKDTHKRVRQEIADLETRIGLQIDALEQGIEPELVGARIAKLRLEKERAEAALGDLIPDGVEPDADELIATLSRVPDLSHALRDAPTALKRQVFEAFCLEVRYDKVERRIEISATVAEAVAKAFETRKTSRRRSRASLQGT